MKQVPSDKYNIAWFKLAECVARGEKERAFGVYRLLAHSFSNTAFVQQLEGDLLLSFGEHEQAVIVYEQAAQSYYDQSALRETAAVYEHLITLEPKKITYLKRLIDLYKELSCTNRLTDLVEQLCTTLIEANQPVQASTAFNRYDQHFTEKEALHLHEKMVFALLKPQTKHSDQALIHIKKVVEGLVKLTANKELQLFLSKIEALDNDCYLQACTYLEKA